MTVSISGFGYGVASGSAPLVVRWTNDDPVEHDAVATDGSWGTPILAPGGSADVRFERPGTYAYLCSVHPFMTASVVVE